MKHGGQPIKQISKLENIFGHPTQPKPITQKKSQHSGIGSHLFYLNLQHCNVSLSFNKIQLIKCSQSISLISSVQLKSSPYQFMWNMFWYIFKKIWSPKFQTFPTKNHVSIIILNYIPCFYTLSVPKKHVTTRVSKSMFRWQITKFLNNYHVSKHVYKNFIIHSWTQLCFNFDSQQT